MRNMKMVACDLVVGVVVSCLCLGLGMPAKALAQPSADKLLFSLPEIVLYNEAQLRQKGYDPNDREAIKRAAADLRNAGVRNAAVRLLGARMGAEALPLVRPALDDPEQMVRCSAATLFATFGNQDGLARMRKDLAQSTPAKTAAQIDRAADMDEVQKSEAKRARVLQLEHALEAGKILSEFGDRSAYDLAVDIVQGDELPSARFQAIRILTDISNTEDATLKKENRDPDAVLLALAVAERDLFVLRIIRAHAQVLPRSESAMKILEALQKSPYVPASDRKDVERSIDFRRGWDAEKARSATGRKEDAGGDNANK
jgi:hypothetical protein